MKASPADKATRRIAVILGPGGSSRHLLDAVTPLLGKDRALEMQGVFIEEAGLRHAAALPFVKELCRVTFSVQEFNTTQFERVLALRMRTAQRALGLLAKRAGISHSFRNVRGSAESLLREIAGQSDITIFEPAGALAPPLQAGPSTGWHSRRVAVYIVDPESCGAVLVTALQLAGGDVRRLSILLDPHCGAVPELERNIQALKPSRPTRIRTLPGSDNDNLTAAVRAESPAMLVLPATGQSTSPEFLADLRKKLRCPICLVRFWNDK